MKDKELELLGIDMFRILILTSIINKILENIKSRGLIVDNDYEIQGNPDNIANEVRDDLNDIANQLKKLGDVYFAFK